MKVIHSMLIVFCPVLMICTNIASAGIHRTWKTGAEYKAPAHVMVAQRGCYATTSCAQPFDTCACTDPECYGRNPCMSSGRCCRVFGNVGSIHANPGDPVDED